MHVPKGKNEMGGFDEAFYYQAPFFPVFPIRYTRIGAAICLDGHFQGASPENREWVMVDLPLTVLSEPDPGGWNLLENRRTDCY